MHNFDAMMDHSETIETIDCYLTDKNLTDAEKVREIDKIVAEWALRHNG